MHPSMRKLALTLAVGTSACSIPGAVGLWSAGSAAKNVGTGLNQGAQGAKTLSNMGADKEKTQSEAELLRAQADRARAEAEATRAGMPTGGPARAADAPVAPGAARDAEPSCIQLAGRWNSTIGVVYDVTQDGSTFRWNVAEGRAQGQIGSGSIAGTSVKVSWTPPGAGTAQGTVTAAGGRATRIEWSNGVVFVR